MTTKNLTIKCAKCASFAGALATAFMALPEAVRSALINYAIQNSLDGLRYLFFGV